MYLGKNIKYYLERAEMLFLFYKYFDKIKDR
jgi:hypothetical protein